jgi:hypothetical protein
MDDCDTQEDRIGRADGCGSGALDAALVAGFPCGGWCPADRDAEDGPIPQRYPLTPLPGGGYRQRTRQNVIDSDGTVILFYESLTGGTLLTRDLCLREKRPFLVLDAKVLTESAAAAAIIRFAEENKIQVLNVAGPRASGWAAGYRFALDVVTGVIRNMGSIDLAAARTP